MAILTLRLGRRRFAPSWLMTLLTIALCLAFIRLGNWQWSKGGIQQAKWDAFTHGSDAPVALGPTPFGALPRFRRISTEGRFDAAHQFLLDNRSHAGSPGYEVLTPFTLTDGRVLLVDRGWVPFTGSRARLPDIGMSGPVPLTVTGRLDNLPAGGLALGHAAPPADGSWPKVTSFPTFAELTSVLGHPVAPWMLLLDPGSPAGYVRDWQPPGISPLRHWSYAVQWWGFAVTLLIIWGIMSAPKLEPRPA